MSLATAGNVCAGANHRTRDLQGGWKQGCATGYTSREARGRQPCTGQYLNDNALTVAVSPRWRSIRCGARIKDLLPNVRHRAPDRHRPLLEPLRLLEPPQPRL